METLTSVAEQLFRAGRLLEAAPTEAARMALEVTQAVGVSALERAKAWLLLGQAEYRQTHLEEALEPLQQAIQLLTPLGCQRDELEAHITLGRVYRELGHLSSATTHLNRALELAQALDQAEVEANILNLQASLEYTRGEYSRALRCLEQALARIQKLDLPEREAHLHSNIGVILTALGDYPKALEQLMEAHNFVRIHAPGSRSEATNLGSIGNLYREMGNHAQALEYYSKTLELARSLRDIPIEIIALNNQANIQQQLKNPTTAQALFKAALELARKAGLQQLEVDNLDGLGQIQYSLGQHNQAIATHSQALSIAQSIEYSDGELNALLNLGRDYLADHHTSCALECLHQAHTQASQRQRQKALIQAHELLSQAYEQQGDYAQALAHQRQFHLLERQLFNEESERKTRNLTIQFELERLRSEAETHRLRTGIAQQARLEAETRVWQRTRELEEAQWDILNRLALAAEYRDDDTGEHTRRVGRNAALLAEALGLPAAECEVIGFAAQLHDVGKIGIPDAILLKPGRFTPEEYELMKSHTTIGSRMLSGGSSYMLKIAEQIALTHHERWDGQGYPAGLVGTDIPLIGRIVAVADVFDALTHERPYKPAWNIAETLQELQRQRGTQFDPAVVEAGLKVFGHPNFQNALEKSSRSGSHEYAV